MRTSLLITADPGVKVEKEESKEISYATEQESSEGEIVGEPSIHLSEKAVSEKDIDAVQVSLESPSPSKSNLDSVTNDNISDVGINKVLDEPKTA